MKMKSLSKTLASSFLAMGMLFLGIQASQATVINLGSLDGVGGNPGDEIDAIKGEFYDDEYCLEFLAKFGEDGEIEGDFADFFTVDFDGASATVSWDLTGTGYLLKNIAVKSADNLNVYEVAPDQGLADSTVVQSDSFNAKGVQQDISHISFFGCPGESVPDGGATIALLGLAVLGLTFGRRFKRA